MSAGFALFRGVPWRTAGRWVAVCALAVAHLLTVPAAAVEDPWRRLDEGLWLANLPAPPPPGGETGAVTVLKIDPARWRLRLLSASENGGVRLTPREWSARHRLAAVINAGMYQEDGFTNAGYMRNFGHLNNPRFNSYRTVLAFNPADAATPPVAIIDLECGSFAEDRKSYQSFVQNLRLIDCHRRNVWQQQEKRWSVAALAVDESGHVLFIFSATQYSGHELADILLALPLAVSGAMYLEGGPQASLYVSAGGLNLELAGSIGPVGAGSEPSPFAWALPNVIGIERRPAP